YAVEFYDGKFICEWEKIHYVFHRYWAFVEVNANTARADHTHIRFSGFAHHICY
ncbi:hypothetical protein D047_1405B, partial [Vibrio parahaemolyticus VPTS-2010_2]